jgi:chromosomal replication initiation ATPase DnaA
MRLAWRKAMSFKGDPSEFSALPTRTIRLFISSTFGDLKEERNALQEEVYPRLRRYCERLGWSFQAIDLRWGVSTEAALDQGTMRICLAEIARCQEVTPRPNFLILLGNRYGWRPLPTEIPDAEFAVLQAHLDPEQREWYHLDRNAEGGMWVLKARTGRFTDQDTWTREVEQPLGEALRQAARHAGFSPLQMLKYEASATEQEIQAGALAQPDAREHVLAVFRELRELDELAAAAQVHPEFRNYLDFTSEGDVDEDATARLTQLKDRLLSHLGASRVRSLQAAWNERSVSSEHIPWLCITVYRDLRRTIRRQIHRAQELSPTQEEQLKHQEFAYKQARDFTGQATAKSLIARYLEDPNEQAPLVLCGPSGSGKSTMLAEIAVECGKRGVPVVCRFGGVTAKSTQATALLRGICEEFDRLYRKPSSELPDDFNLLADALQERLRLCSEKQPIVLIIDGLDLISAPNWSWIPHALPAHVRIVVSATSGPILEKLRACLPERCFHELDAMVQDDGRLLLGKWLTRAGRQLTPQQASVVMEGFSACRLPLYLRLAFEDAKQWHSDDSVSPLPSDVDGMIERLLHRLSEEKNHGRLLVSRVIGYLVSSRMGLTESEIVDLLASDEEYWAHFSQRIARHDLPTRRLPIVIWLRLYHDLRPYFSWRASGGLALMTFFHRAFGKVAESWYVGDSWNGQTAHRRMGTYFEHLALPRRRRQWAAASSRALSELAHQRRSDIRRRYREHLFGDVRFVAAAIEHGLANEILEDLEAAGVPDMREAVLSGLGAIRARPKRALVILVNRLRNKAIPVLLAAYRRRAEAELDASGMWIRSLTSFGDKRMLAGVISITPSRGVFHAVSDGDELEEYDLASCQLRGRRALPPEVVSSSVVVDAIKDRAAWADRTGVNLDGDLLPFRLRYPPNCLGFFGDGLIGIDQTNSLLWFDTEQRVTSVLATQVSPVFAAVAFTPDRRTAAVIDGDRLPEQRILLLHMEGGEARTTEWARLPFQVSAVCLNEDGSVMVVATRSRELKLYDVADGSLMREVSYRVASGSAVRGIIRECCALAVHGRLNCLMATSEGELLTWDSAGATVRRRGVYRGTLERDELTALEAVPVLEQFAVATRKWIRMLSVDGEDSIATSLPVSQCSYWPDGWLATTSATSVTWFEDGAWRSDFAYANHEPTAIAAHGNGGAVYVGYKNGSIARLEPGQKPGYEDGLDLFDHPVCAVMPMRGDRVLAVSKQGELKIVRFRPADVERVLAKIDNLREEQLHCWLGGTEDLVSCGRCHHGNAHTSVVVLRKDDTRETILETPELAVALAAGSCGSTVYIAFKDRVVRYRYGMGWWFVEGERHTPIEAMRSAAGGMLAVVLQESGGSWLELWSGAEDLQTLAATELPLNCTALAGAGQVIAVGASDGKHCLLEIRNEEGRENETV